jgi:hypothetical protein
MGKKEVATYSHLKFMQCLWAFFLFGFCKGLIAIKLTWCDEIGSVVDHYCNILKIVGWMDEI